MRKEQWTKCYHIINTNMSLESFHHLLKHISIKRKVNKRVVTCVHIFTKFPQVEALNRLLKMEKRKTTQNHWYQQKHNTSLKLSTTAILTSFDTQWEVKSSSSSIYTFSLKNANDHYNVCIHTYSRTCPDSLINASICKHIHFVAL